MLDAFEGDPDSSRFTEQILPFKKVVESKEPYQVCRMFLATLQLVSVSFLLYTLGAGRKFSFTATCLVRPPILQLLA